MPARNALFFVCFFFLFKTKLTAAHTCGVKCKVMELDRQLNSFPTCSCSPFSEHFMVIIIQVVAFLSGTMSIEQVKEKFGNLYSTGGKKKKWSKRRRHRRNVKNTASTWHCFQRGRVESTTWAVWGTAVETLTSKPPELHYSAALHVCAIKLLGRQSWYVLLQAHQLRNT